MPGRPTGEPWARNKCLPSRSHCLDLAHASLCENRSGESFAFYTEVPSLLRAARSANISLSLASRTHTPDLAQQLLRFLQVPQAISAAGNAGSTSSAKANDFFVHPQIFPGDKRTHLRNLNRLTGTPFEDMLFFDDESRNRNVESLGACFWLVRDGVTRDEVDNGVSEWRKRKGSERH